MQRLRWSASWSRTSGWKQFGRRAWQSMLRRWCQNFPKQCGHGLQVEWWVYYQVVRMWRATEVLSRRSGKKKSPKEWWRCHDWDNDKLLNGNNNLELFKEVVKLIHRNRCKTALWRKAAAVELSHVCDQGFPWPNARKLKCAACHKACV